MTENQLSLEAGTGSSKDDYNNDRHMLNFFSFSCSDWIKAGLQMEIS